jgi:hypothetical protein
MAKTNINIIRKFGWLGIICFLVYSLGLILVWALIPNYNNFNRAISDLLIDSDYRTIFDTIFLVYNISIFLYGMSIVITNRNWGLRINIMAAGLIMVALTGILMFFFPTDLQGAAKSLHGSIHLFLAGLMALLALFTTFEGYFVFTRSKIMKLLSLTLSFGIFVFAFLTLLFDLKQINTGLGLVERITVFLYASWMMVSGIYFLKVMGGTAEGMQLPGLSGEKGNELNL